MDVKIFRRFADEIMRGFFSTVEIPLRQKEMHLLTLMDMEKERPLHFYARHISLEKGSFTYLTEVMEEKGYIERYEDSYDRRRKFLKLTDKGKSIVKNVRMKEEEYLENIFRTMPEEDKDILRNANDVIKKFLSNMPKINIDRDDVL